MTSFFLLPDFPVPFGNQENPWRMSNPQMKLILKMYFGSSFNNSDSLFFSRSNVSSLISLLAFNFAELSRL